MASSVANVVAKGMVNKLTSSAMEELRAMFSEHGKPAGTNSPSEFDNAAFNKFLASPGIGSRLLARKADAI